MEILKYNIKNVAILSLWLIPILLSISTEKFINSESTGSIRYIYGVYIIISILIFNKLNVELNKIDIKILALACLIYLPIILSDYTNFLKWIYWVSYCLIIMAVSAKYYEIIFSQYIKFCVMIFYLSLIDLISYFIFDSMSISINPIELVGFMPRINTIFDEMSHQAFFLMPALLYVIINGSYKYACQILIAFVTTISAQFLAALPIVLIILGFKYKKNKSFYLALFSAAIFFLVFGEFIISKMQYGYIYEELDNLTFPPSVIIIYISILLLSNIEYKTLFLGDGFFRDPFILNQSRILYEIQDKFLLTDITRLPGVFDLVYTYGIILLLLIIFLIINIRKTTANKLVFDACILSVLTFMFYNPHYVDYPVWIFIFFSLALSSPKVRN